MVCSRLLSGWDHQRPRRGGGIHVHPMSHFDGKQYQAGVSNLPLVFSPKYLDPGVLFFTHVYRLSGAGKYSAILR